MFKKNKLLGGSLAVPKSGKYGVAKSVDKVAREKASKALANAKQRCTNKNNGDYPNYGGAGIQVLIKDVQALVKAIGLPQAGYSLDRIDPSGHYEIGNVRWANAALQAVNKKASFTNSHLFISAQIDASKDAAAMRADRKVVAVAWFRAVNAFNDGHLPIKHACWLAQNLTCEGVIDANFDFDTAFDHSDAAPGYIHLPALSRPNSRVRIRCGPTLNAGSGWLRAVGRLGGLELLDAEWNVAPGLWKLVQQIVSGKGAGAALFGQPSEEDLLGGWVEGSCLAMASRIAREFGVRTACFPILRVNRVLGDLGSAELWDEIEHPVLDVRALMIPDFSLDCGSWGDGKDINWYRVERLLRYRYERGFQTFVGVQNFLKLHPPIKELVGGAFMMFKMPPTKPHKLEAMQFSLSTYGIPEGSVGLRDIRADPSLAGLAQSFCI